MAPQDETASSVDPQAFRRLVETADAAGGARDAYSGKRGARRLAAGIQLDVTTDPDTPSSAWPVIMHNVSDSGFAFWSKRRLRTRGWVWVREFTPDNALPWVPARVTHCTVGIKGYLVGAAFESPPNEKPSVR